MVNIDAADRWIYHLGVTADERDRGIGAYVLSEALAGYWSNHPGETLGLSVQADNLPALRLYRRQGFAPLLVLQAFELPLYVRDSWESTRGRRARRASSSTKPCGRKGAATAR